MKIFFKHITAYFLILLVLVSSINVSITKITCLMSGRVEYSLAQMQECNPSEEDCGAVRNNCCDFYNATLNFEYQTVVKQISFGVDLITIPFTESFVSNIENLFFTTLVGFYANSSPPLSGYSLLKFIQVFRL